LDEWRKINADKRILKGVTPEWRYTGADRVLQHLRWPKQFRGSLQQKLAYAELLKEELQEEIVEQVDKRQLKWCNPSFLVPKSSGGWRKIVDCRTLNGLLKDKGFKMEGFDTALQLAKTGDWATKLDIKAAYNHIPVQKSFRAFLGFSFGGRWYQYTTMPFGLKSAPRIFTKVMRPVIQQIRVRWDARVVCYMDDLLLLFDSEEEALTTTREVVLWLQALGWKMSTEKCVMEPRQQITFVGWALDLENGQFMMPKARRRQLMEALVMALQWCRRRKRVRVRWLAALIGQLNFLRTQFPEALLHTGRLITTKNAAVRREGWKGGVRMTPFLHGELKWWAKAVRFNKPRPWETPPTSATLTTDASPWGWGATLERTNGPKIYLWEQWTADMGYETSNYKELNAILCALRASLGYVQPGTSLRIQSDNTSAVWNIRRWKGKGRRGAVLRRLRRLADEKQLTIQVQHLPGATNGEADSLSRMGGSSEYCMTTATLERIRSAWNLPMTLDAFASRETHLLERYATRNPGDSEATAIDGLRMTWSNEIVLAHPPLRMIQQCLRKIEDDKCLAVLISPDWRGQAWSKQLAQMSRATIQLGAYDEAMTRTRVMHEKGWHLPPGRARADIVDGRTMQVMRCSGD
jgi:ribonuclease HI